MFPLYESERDTGIFISSGSNPSSPSFPAADITLWTSSSAAHEAHHGPELVTFKPLQIESKVFKFSLLEGFEEMSVKKLINVTVELIFSLKIKLM